MKLHPRHLSIALLGVVFALGSSFTSTAKAQSVNWASVNYTAGQLNQNVTLSDGNVATFAFTGYTGQFISAATVNGTAIPTPAVGTYGTTTTATTNTTYCNGGLGQSGLQMYVNFAANTQAVTLTVTFANPVPSVNFNLFDVDQGSLVTNTTGTYTFLDEVSNITASADGTNYTIAPTLTGSTYNTVTGSGTLTNAVYGSSGNSPANQGLANVGVTFSNAGGIKSFQLTYGDHVSTTGITSQADPANEIIALGNITVPEPGTVACSAAGVLAIGCAVRARRRTSARGV